MIADQVTGRPEQRFLLDTGLPEDVDCIPARGTLAKAVHGVGIHVDDVPHPLEQLGQCRRFHGAHEDAALHTVAPLLEGGGGAGPAAVLGDVVGDHYGQRHDRPVHVAERPCTKAATLSACRYRCLRRLPAKSGRAPRVNCSIRRSYPRMTISRPARVSSTPGTPSSRRPCSRRSSPRRATATTIWSTISGRNSSMRSSARPGRVSSSACSIPTAGSSPAAPSADTASPSNTA